MVGDGGCSVAERGVVPLQLLLPARGLRVPMLPFVLLTALRLGAGDVVLLVPVLALLFLLLPFLLTAMLVLVRLTKGQPNRPGAESSPRPCWESHPTTRPEGLD